jgi:hypothetical protein
MNGQPLPGMYWDAEKKKYFSIKSAKGMDVKYSQENIQKAERKERIRKIATARSDKIRKERVVRRYPHSFALTHVEREIGSKRRSFYVQNLWPNACASGVNQESDKVISGQTRVRLFDRYVSLHRSQSQELVRGTPGYLKTETIRQSVC